MVPQKNTKLANALQMAVRPFSDLRLGEGEDFLGLRTHYKTKLNMNSLAIAALLGLNHLLRPILESGANIDARGGRVGNALQTATYCDNLDGVRILLDLGADIDCPYTHFPQDTPGYFPGFGSALMTAIFLGHQKVIDLLLARGARLNAVEGSAGTPLHAAAIVNDVKTIGILIEGGA